MCVLHNLSYAGCHRPNDSIYFDHVCVCVFEYTSYLCCFSKMCYKSDECTHSAEPLPQVGLGKTRMTTDKK